MSYIAQLNKNTSERLPEAFCIGIKSRDNSLNISKYEQRVLHVLAQGGRIEFERAANGKVTEVTCYNRNGHVLVDCTLPIFERLKKRGLIKSKNGKPYRATRLGITSVRSQLDNR